MTVMNAGQDLIEELEGAIANKGIGHRADMLRRITNLFAAGSTGFESEQLALFDDVMGRLVEDVDAPVRALVAERLAPIANAPPMIIRTLALDQSIDVAGPVLSRSDRVDEETLVISAKTRGQDHLLAISRRRSLGEAVTDVLVERGVARLPSASRQITARISPNTAMGRWWNGPNRTKSLPCASGRDRKFRAATF